MKAKTGNPWDYVLVILVSFAWIGGATFVCYELIIHEHWILAFIIAYIVFMGIKIRIHDKSGD